MYADTQKKLNYFYVLVIFFYPAILNDVTRRANIFALPVM